MSIERTEVGKCTSGISARRQGTYSTWCWAGVMQDVVSTRYLDPLPARYGAGVIEVPLQVELEPLVLKWWAKLTGDNRSKCTSKHSALGRLLRYGNEDARVC